MSMNLSLYVSLNFNLSLCLSLSQFLLLNLSQRLFKLVNMSLYWFLILNLSLSPLFKKCWFLPLSLRLLQSLSVLSVSIGLYLSILICLL